jgi:hypothetical protein
MVGRLVEQQQVGFLQQHLAQRDAPPFAAGECPGVGVAGRQAHGVHGDFEMAVEVPGVSGGNGVLHLIELALHLVHLCFGQRLAEFRSKFLGAHQQAAQRSDGLFEVALDVGGLVEARLLRNETDADATVGFGGAEEVAVFQGHDAQQRTLAGAVRADDADLGAGIEGQPDVLEDLAFAVGLGEALDGEDVFLGHGLVCLSSLFGGESLILPEYHRHVKRSGRQEYSPGELCVSRHSARSANLSVLLQHLFGGEIDARRTLVACPSRRKPRRGRRLGNKIGTAIGSGPQRQQIRIRSRPVERHGLGILALARQPLALAQVGDLERAVFLNGLILDSSEEY